MDREALGVIVAAMSLPNVLDRLIADVAVIAPSDRTDLIPGLMLAHQSGTFPPLAGILLTGGYQIPESIRRLAEGVQQDLPIALTDLGTFTHRRAADAGPGPDHQGLEPQDRDRAAGCSPSKSIKQRCSPRSTSRLPRCVRR